MSELEQVCLRHWDQPNPRFSHGQDRRSSDRVMLQSLYGGLVSAADHNFQNAGRVLVDRTDVRMLLEGYGLALPVRPLDACCREIEYLIRGEVFSVWSDLHHDHSRILDAGILSDRMALQCFGGQDYRLQARWLVFFLLPMLNVSAPGGGVPVERDTVDLPHGLLELVSEDVGLDWWSRRLAWQRWFDRTPSLCLD